MTGPANLIWEEAPCNLCGADDYRRLYERPVSKESLTHVRDFLATSDQFGDYGRIVRCRRCGLTYTNPRLRLDRILQGYTQAEDTEYAEEAESRSINAYFTLAAIRRHTSKGRLLDVGCAHGYLLNAARVHFEVRGIELSSCSREYARKQLGLTVDAATLREAAYPDAHFDVVTMVDVIEHLTDPLADLRDAHRILKPGGVLYLVTPDLSGLAAKLLRGRWWGLRPAHLYYFDPKTMSAMLEKAGFETLETRSFGKIFTYGYWLSRIRNYPRLFSGPIGWAVNTFNLHEKFLYLDTRDSMQVIARRKE